MTDLMKGYLIGVAVGVGAMTVAWIVVSVIS